MQEPQHNHYAAPRSSPLPEQADIDLAGRGARFAAVMIDGVINATIMFPAMYLTGMWGRLMSATISPVELIAWAVAGFVLYLALHGRLLKQHGQTIGKRWLGIQTVAVDTGEVISMQKMVLARILPVNVVANLPPPLNYLGLIDALMIFRRDRRCLHDMLAGTRVVMVRKA
jgi:uncharacterized RDD family membrane protein YckC